MTAPAPFTIGRWQVALRNGATEQTIAVLRNGFTYTESVHTPYSIQFQLDGDDRICNQIVELASDVVLYRQNLLNVTNQRRFRGRVTLVEDDVQSDNYNVNVAAQAYGQLLQTRGVPDPGVTYSQVEQMTIVQNLIALTQAQTSGSLGITTGTLSGTAQLRDRTFPPANPSIGKLIDDMSNVSNGYDWWIDELLQLQIRSPRRVRDFNDVLNYPGNVHSLKRSSTVAQFRNWVRETGEPSTTPAIASALPDTRGRFELSEANSGVVIQQTLVERAAGVLASRSTPRANYIVTLEQGVWGTQFVSEPGDIMRMQFRRGRWASTPINGDARILEQKFTVTNDGAEQVQMSLLAE